MHCPANAMEYLVSPVPKLLDRQVIHALDQSPHVGVYIPILIRTSSRGGLVTSSPTNKLCLISPNMFSIPSSTMDLGLLNSYARLLVQKKSGCVREVSYSIPFPKPRIPQMHLSDLFVLWIQRSNITLTHAIRRVLMTTGITTSCSSSGKRPKLESPTIYT